jgi:ribose transport system permease protein
MAEETGARTALGPQIPAWLARAPGAFYVLAAMTVLLSFLTPGFFTAANLVNIGLQLAVLTIVSLGMTLVILTEGIDLSAGPVLSLCGVCAGLVLVAGHPLPVAIAAAVAVGALCGALNGALIAFVGLPPFIVTLGMFGIAQSVATVLTGGLSVTGLPGYFQWFNTAVPLGIPVPLWAIAGSFGLTYLLLYHARFGRYVFAIGGNRRALQLSGSPVNAYHAAVYVYAGVLAALASFIMTARMNSAHPTVGVGLEFDAIAAVILGGTSFEQGRGGLAGTMVGAFAVGVMRNGLNLAGIGAEWQVSIVGIVIIGAVGLDSWRNRHA